VNSWRSTASQSGSDSSGCTGISKFGAAPFGSYQAKIAPLCSTTGYARVRAFGGMRFAYGMPVHSPAPFQRQPRETETDRS
jgi:hypothetical protein